MPVRPHHIVVDTHDPPGLARFWTQALGWQVLSERQHEIVVLGGPPGTVRGTRGATDSDGEAT